MCLVLRCLLKSNSTTVHSNHTSTHRTFDSHLDSVHFYVIFSEEESVEKPVKRRKKEESKEDAPSTTKKVQANKKRKRDNELEVI